MFKLIRIFIYLVIIAGIVVAFILWNGGDKIRWFGEQSEDVGKTIKEKSKYIGKQSDEIKEKLEEKKEVIEEKIDTVVEEAEKRGIIRREGADKEKEQ